MSLLDLDKLENNINREIIYNILNKSLKNILSYDTRIANVYINSKLGDENTDWCDIVNNPDDYYIFFDFVYDTNAGSLLKINYNLIDKYYKNSDDWIGIEVLWAGGSRTVKYCFENGSFY